MSERSPGPVWGGWWFWEPPAGKAKESRGFFADLTPEQKAAALAYRGPESHGQFGDRRADYRRCCRGMDRCAYYDRSCEDVK